MGAFSQTKIYELIIPTPTIIPIMCFSRVTNNDQIRSQFPKWQGTCAVVTCAKLSSDWIIRFVIIWIWVFKRFKWTHKSFVNKFLEHNSYFAASAKWSVYWSSRRSQYLNFSNGPCIFIRIFMHICILYRKIMCIFQRVAAGNRYHLCLSNPMN